MEPFNFTKQSVEEFIDTHDGFRLDARDSKIGGLILSLRPGGSATFYVYRRFNGQPLRYKLGTYPAVSVEQARNLAHAAIGKMATGIDPREGKIARRGELTLGALLKFYLEQHAKPKKRSWKEDEKQFDRYLSAWKNRKLSSIRKADVQALHAKLGQENGVYAANRLRSLLCTMFNVAADAGWTGANPVLGVKKFPEQKRERFLRADELPKFFEALEADPSTKVRDFVKVALLTGARRGNVMAMRWADVHLERAEWVIPLTKAGTPQTVHLPAAAVEILRARKSAADEKAAQKSRLTKKKAAPCQWVFPGRGKSGHLSAPNKIWKQIVERAGLPGLRIHDLRRTLGSWQAATGASLPIIGKSLGHRNASTTQIYARLDLDPVRQAVDTAAKAMLAAALPAENIAGDEVEQPPTENGSKKKPKGIAGPERG